jgi:hypothetical protein
MFHPALDGPKGCGGALQSFDDGAVTPGTVAKQNQPHDGK